MSSLASNGVGSMPSPVAELESNLRLMQNLKPPGVSSSKINVLTTLCVQNVQSESVLIQKIYTHFKKAPATHKLGVLYVVDSVTRKWLDHAKAQGQPVNGSAQDGTYAAGVHRVTELMPVLMNDIMQSAPADQKEKIRKLVDIWEKGQTFPPPMLNQFKDKLNARQQNESTTPPGSPPVGLLSQPNGNPTAGAPALPTNIMEALASITRQTTTATPSNPPIPAPVAPYNVSHTPTNQAAAAPAPFSFPSVQQTGPPAPFPSTTTTQQSPSHPAGLAGLPFAAALAGLQASAANGPVSSNQAGGFPGVQGSPMPVPSGGLDPNVQQQLMLIKALADQGIPYDKIPAIVGALGNTGGAAPGAAPGAIPGPGPGPLTAGQNAYGSQAQGAYGVSGVGAAGAANGHGSTTSWDGQIGRESHDRNFNEVSRSPNRFRNRSRSRSPGRHWDGGRDSYRGRHSPRGGRGRGSGSDYRQRSPPGRRGASPDPPSASEKWVEFDPKLPPGHIRVLSRTLFVGGVTCSENELRDIFNRHGRVQTCIVNKEKRHAFVKMYRRDDAVKAKEAMEDARNLELPLRTRWGVGFGPRDCSDYATGVSVIPINKLTEADRKWMVSAQWGGSGGRPIAPGICVEEPDIEIGAGVSSKAISRRMQTDKGGSNGPRSSKKDDEEGGGGGGSGGGGGGGGRWRRGRDGGREHRRDGERDNQEQGNGQAGVAHFPFGIQMGPNGMPIYPPNFAFPDPTSNGN